jgi:hypothetical protein
VVLSILKHPAYAGTAYFHRYGTTEPGFTQRLGKSARKSPPHAFGLRPKEEKEEWVPIDGPAIISAALFEQAQEQWRQNRNSGGKMGSWPKATAAVSIS